MKRTLPLLFSLGLLLALLAAVSVQQPAALAQQPPKLPEPRIVGGDPASPGEWPATAAVYLRSYSPAQGQFCAGTLIAPTWVLTAAHCARAYTSSDLNVLLNTTSLNAQGERIEVDERIVDPRYNAGTDQYDFALLRLRRASSTTPLALITQADSALTNGGRNATVVGWGATSEGGSGSDNLLEVVVPIVDDATCDSEYSQFGGIDPVSMLCAGAAGKDSCQGDSGGPLMIQRATGQWLLAGVVSTGYGCARPNYPGIYAEALAGLSFISQHIGGTSPTPTPTATPFPLPTPKPGATPTPTPVATSTPAPTAAPTATPAGTPAGTPPPKPTPPGSTPAPTATPGTIATPTPTPTPTATPTPAPLPAWCVTKPQACL